ncbi:hypothetical protein TNCV_1807901 [Trichonephila clavipes]|nr:hypothetical protein TNCV_1807901 [Trichonephila clavipes]
MLVRGWRTSGSRAINGTRHNILDTPVIKMRLDKGEGVTKLATEFNVGKASVGDINELMEEDGETAEFLTDDDIAAAVTQEPMEEEGSDDETQCDKKDVVPHADGAAALALRYLEQQPDTTPADVLFMRRWRNYASSKRLSSLHSMASASRNIKKIALVLEILIHRESDERQIEEETNVWTEHRNLHLIMHLKDSRAQRRVKKYQLKHNSFGHYIYRRNSSPAQAYAYKHLFDNLIFFHFLPQRLRLGALVNVFLSIDGAHFWLNGYVNKQNCRIWSEANPQVYVETPLHPEKLTVWCALWAGGILLQKR